VILGPRAMRDAHVVQRPVTDEKLRQRGRRGLGVAEESPGRVGGPTDRGFPHFLLGARVTPFPSELPSAIGS